MSLTRKTGYWRCGEGRVNTDGADLTDGRIAGDSEGRDCLTAEI